MANEFFNEGEVSEELISVKELKKSERYRKKRGKRERKGGK